MLRLPISIFIGSLLLSGSTAKAQNSDEQAWLEMMEVCVRVISERSDRIMDELPAIATLLELDSLPKRAVRHPDSPVVASALSDGSQWFMCLVAGDPPRKLAEKGKGTGGLIGAITGTLARQVDQSNDHALALTNVFAPVRVTCHDDGGMTATLAFLTKDKEFRVVVANSLPSGVANPCLAADGETAR